MLPWLVPAYMNYRQSIESKGIEEQKIIRQTGGVCEYAHVELSVEPLAGTIGFRFREQGQAAAPTVRGTRGAMRNCRNR